MCQSHHLVNAHEVKPVRLIQSLCAVCGSNLAGLTLLYIVLPCVAAVVSRPAWRMLVLLIVRYVTNLINEHYYYYYYYANSVGCVAQLVERRSLTDELSLSHARPIADG